MARNKIALIGGGNIGGTLSGVVVGYLATWFGWTVPFLVAAGLCVAAALIATRIDPTQSAVETPG